MARDSARNGENHCRRPSGFVDSQHRTPTRLGFLSRKDIAMRQILTAAALVVATSPLLAAEPQPPQGFTALFNGKDLAGWHGMPGFDPYKLAAMKPEERDEQIAKWTADAKEHWKVENGELVNDGHGAYLATDRAYGDIELLIDYKTV